MKRRKCACCKRVSSQFIEDRGQVICVDCGLRIGEALMENLKTSRATELAESLKAYTDPASPEYDPDFDEEIRELRPDWFCHEMN